jgi:hypothetical protein
MSRLDIHESRSVRAFKRSIRQTKEIFLRFTHRYWFHEISDQAQARDLYRMWAGQLGTDTLYDEVRQEILDMNDYLDSDQVRRQADTVVRLTVITVLGLILNVVTGYFGMNLLAEADQPLAAKVLFFLLVLVPVTALIIYAIAKSKRLSFFLEAMSNERMDGRGKLQALLAVWPRRAARRAEERIGSAADWPHSTNRGIRLVTTTVTGQVQLGRACGLSCSGRSHRICRTIRPKGEVVRPPDQRRLYGETGLAGSQERSKPE